MSVQPHESSTLIRSVLTYAMKEKTALRIEWDCVTLNAIEDHVVFTIPDDKRNPEKVAAIEAATKNIWFELHSPAVN